MKSKFKIIIYFTVLVFIFSGISFAYNESPMIQEQAEKGELPSLEDRLPPEPLVVEPVKEIGQYGGTWRHGSLGPGMGLIRMSIHYEPLFRWNRDNTEIIPNLAKNWKYSNDHREITIYLREGIKWSDGEPYTVDDFIFYWEDLAMDEDVPITAPHYYRGGGEWMEVEKIDDYTMKWKFVEPNHLTELQSGWNCFESSAHQVPAHYIKEYHPKYNEDATYDQLEARYHNPHQYEDRPMLTAWITKEYREGEGAIFERNPYYWKVDPEGNQLPYIDNIDSEIYEDNEVLRLALQTGEIDFQTGRGVLYDLRHLPSILQNQEKHDYSVELFRGDEFGNPILMLNYHYPEEEIQELFYEQKFRKALSHAINRQRINDILHLGRAKIRQSATMYPGLGSYNVSGGKELYEEWTNLFVEYDPELAEEYLDEIGMVDKNGDGWRERPDGEEFEAKIDVPADDNQLIEGVDLIIENWEEIGIKGSINTVTGSQLNLRKTESYEYMLHARGPNSSLDHFAAPDHWVPIDNTGYGLLGGYGLWYRTGGERGIKPPEDSPWKKLQELYDRAVQEPERDKQYEWILEAYKIHVEEGPLVIGTVGEEPMPVIINNNFKNVTDHMWLFSWSFGQPGASNPEQFFFKE